MDITIITPCSRPENLLKLKQSIDFKCEWIIVYDSESLNKQFDEPWIIEMNIKGGVSGNLQRNTALEVVRPGTWVYFLDDDNIIHPRFKRLARCIKNMPMKGYIFGQDLLDGRVRMPEPDKIKVCQIDQAQYLLHMDLIGNKRFKQLYEADGHFIEEIYNEHYQEIYIMEIICCYYNYLRK